MTSTTSKSRGASQEKDETQIAHARTLKNIPWCEQYERMVSGMLYVLTTRGTKRIRCKEQEEIKVQQLTITYNMIATIHSHQSSNKPDLKPDYGVPDITTPSPPKSTTSNPW